MDSRYPCTHRLDDDPGGKPLPERRKKESGSIAQGIVLITVAVFLLSVADASVKYFSGHLPLWQLFLLVSCISVPILGAWFVLRLRSRQLQVHSVTWIIIRSLLLLLMWVAYYAALPLIPLSVAAVAIYTTPLFIALISALYGGEQLSRIGWVAVVLGFAGVILVLRPGSEAFVVAAVLPVIGAVFYALAMVVTRRHCQFEHPLVLALGLNIAFLVAACAGGLASLSGNETLATGAPFLFGGWQSLNWQVSIFICCYAVVLVAINTATARAYQVAPSAIIGTFDYAYLIFACLWGYLLFDEVPDALTWSGMLVILTAGILIVRPNSGT